jgi:hypothetical protein
MAIASFKPDLPTALIVNTPKIEPKPYESILVNGKQEPLLNLIAYIEGAPWTVIYYSQIVSKHNDRKDLDTGQPDIYQQYNKIIGLELRVTSPLTDSHDSETAITTVTGTAYIYPTLIPNVGDVFIASTGNSSDGIFRISQVERKSFNKQAVFQIEYDLLAFEENDPERFNELNNKAIRTYYFHKDRLIQGLNPTVLEPEHNAIQDIEYLFSDICRYYFKTFFNQEYSTLLLPGQEVKVYDSYLVNYLLKILDTTAAPEIKFIKALNTEREKYLNQPTIWHILLERDLADLDYVNNNLGLISVSAFSRDATLNSIRYSRINYLMYPILPDTTDQSNPIIRIKEAGELNLIDSRSTTGTLLSLIEDRYIDQNRGYDLIKPVLIDEHYVLSSNFYKQKTELSLLEMLVLDYLKYNALDPVKIMALANHYRRWGRLEQFYYLPILLTLMRATNNRLY